MFKVFNMGTRLEVYTDIATAKEIISIAQCYNIDAQIIGRVEELEHKDRSKVSMRTTYGEWEY
jgi:phosphoribosylformylglycinamidine cyclo-ligase